MTPPPFPAGGVGCQFEAPPPHEREGCQFDAPPCSAYVRVGQFDGLFSGECTLTETYRARGRPTCCQVGRAVGRSVDRSVGLQFPNDALCISIWLAPSATADNPTCATDRSTTDASCISILGDRVRNSGEPHPLIMKCAMLFLNEASCKSMGGILSNRGEPHPSPNLIITCATDRSTTDASWRSIWVASSATAENPTRPLT